MDTQGWPGAQRSLTFRVHEFVQVRADEWFMLGCLCMSPPVVAGAEIAERPQRVAAVVAVSVWACDAVQMSSRTCHGVPALRAIASGLSKIPDFQILHADCGRGACAHEGSRGVLSLQPSGTAFAWTMFSHSCLETWGFYRVAPTPMQLLRLSPEPGRTT